MATIRQIVSPLPMLPGRDLPRHKATPVKAYAEIAADVEAMKPMVEQKWPGKYELAYALAHSQVRHQHRAFFVLHGDLVTKPEGDAGKGWKRAFPHRVIINPKVLERPPKLSKELKQLNGVRVAAIKNTGGMPEACLSFPYRTTKNVLRYHRIKVYYETPDGIFGSLKAHTEWLEGLAAHIFQHETDHLNGQNIFFA